MIKLNNLGKTYISNSTLTVGIEHITVSFDINEFVMITGESGSGKSTLLQILAGTEPYSYGRMIVDSENVEYYGEDEWQRYRRDKVAIIHQDFQLIEDMSVYKNIEIAYALNHDDKSKCEEAINEIIYQTGLSDQANKKVHSLSGGQKQRVAIARALAKDTPIILADEPTGNLDSIASQEVAQLLKKISKNKLIIVVTHNEEYFEDVVTRHLVMRSGTIALDSSPQNQSTEKEPSFYERKEKPTRRRNEVTALLKSTFFMNKKINTSFSVTVFSVMLIVLLLASAMLQYFTQTNEGIMYTPVFGGVEKERLIIRNDDGSAFSTAQINKFRADTRFSYIVENDIILDIMFEIEFKYDYGTVRNQYYSNTVESAKVKPENLVWGRMPVSDDEILISSGETYQEIDKSMREVLISAVHNPQKNKKVKIVGGFIDTDKYQQTIYFTNNAAHQISYEFSDKYSNIEITNLESGATNSQAIVSFVNNSAENGVIYISQMLANEISLSTKSEDENIVKIKNSTPFYIKTGEFSTVETISSENNPFSEYTIGEDDRIIIFSPNDFSKIFSEDTYQISAYMNSPNKYKEIITELEDNSMMVFYPATINIINPDSSDIITHFFIFMLSAALAFILICLSILAIKKQSKKESIKYAIILSLGYDLKSIVVTDVIKNLGRVIFGSVPCVIIYSVVNMVKEMYSRRLSHTFIPLANIPILFTALLIVTVSVAYIISFSKRTLKLGKKTSITQMIKVGDNNI